jgi:hypothetical protein
MTMKTRHDGAEWAGVDGGSSPATAMVPGAMPEAGERVEKAKKRSKRKAAKLRAVWISFTGRIVAQFVGSAASIVLGMSLIQNYKAPAEGAEKASLVSEPVVYQGRVARLSEAGGRRRSSVVVLPIDDYSQAAPGDLFAQALTECVTASLA